MFLAPCDFPVFPFLRFFLGFPVSGVFFWLLALLHLASILSRLGQEHLPELPAAMGFILTLSTIIIAAIFPRDSPPNRPRSFRQCLGLLGGFFLCCLQPQLRCRFFLAPLGSCNFFLRSPSPTLALFWCWVWFSVRSCHGGFFWKSCWCFERGKCCPFFCSTLCGSFRGSL